MARNTLCECGCGGSLPPTGRPDARFLMGHWARTTRIRDPYQPKPEEIPSGFCECGCGGKTEIAERSLLKYRQFKGHPKRYLPHHHMRVEARNRTGERHSQWKGGKIVTDEGYVAVLKPEGHPSKRKYVLEHRLVMEKMLGRYLEPFEQVHHKNGNKKDNRPANLELWKRSQPDGVRAKDYHCSGCQCFEFQTTSGLKT